MELLLETYDVNSDESLCGADIQAWALEPVDFNDDEVADTADLSLLMQAIAVYNEE